MSSIHQRLAGQFGLAVALGALAACASVAASGGTAASSANGALPATADDARAQAFHTWLSPLYGVTPDLMRPDGQTMINGLMPANPDDQS